MKQLLVNIILTVVFATALSGCVPEHAGVSIEVDLEGLDVKPIVFEEIPSYALDRGFRKNTNNVKNLETVNGWLQVDKFDRMYISFLKAKSSDDFVILTFSYESRKKTLNIRFHEDRLKDDLSDELRAMAETSLEWFEMRFGKDRVSSD